MRGALVSIHALQANQTIEIGFQRGKEGNHGNQHWATRASALICRLSFVDNRLLVWLN